MEDRLVKRLDREPTSPALTAVQERKNPAACYEGDALSGGWERERLILTGKTWEDIWEMGFGYLERTELQRPKPRKWELLGASLCSF